jgi:hypothetical protein
MAKNETPRTPDVAVVIDADEGTLKFTFGDGVTRLYDMRDFPNEILRYATLHGLKQKINDAAAIQRNPETGKSATIQEKRDAIEAMASQIGSGEWNKTGEGDGSSGLGLLARALTRLYPDRDIKVFVAGLSKEQQAAMRASARVRTVIDVIKAEDAARKPAVKAVDVNALFAKLDN